jgi:hypothetical protein
MLWRVLQSLAELWACIWCERMHRSVALLVFVCRAVVASSSGAAWLAYVWDVVVDVIFAEAVGIFAGSCQVLL